MIHVYIIMGVISCQKLTLQQYWHEWCVHKYNYGDKYETVVENSHGSVISELKKHTADYETDEHVHDQFEQ